MVPHDDPALLVSVAAYVYRAYTDRGVRFRASCRAMSALVGDKWVVVRLTGANGKEQQSHRVRCPAAATSSTMARTTRSVSDWKLGESLFNGTCNGEEFTMQVERHKTKYSLFHWGTRADFMVMSARAAELLSLMPEKLPPDLSKFLMSPMPGLLREVSVKVGQEVKAGEKAGHHRSDEDGKHPQGRAGLQGQEDRRCRRREPVGGPDHHRVRVSAIFLPNAEVLSCPVPAFCQPGVGRSNGCAWPRTICRPMAGYRGADHRFGGIARWMSWIVSCASWTVVTDFRFVPLGESAEIGPEW